jgi:nicotinamide riboside transporter PnuC
MEGPNEGQVTPSGRIIIGRRPMALRFALTLIILVIAVVVLAVAGQWVLSILMLAILLLLGFGFVYWARDKSSGH